MSFFAVHAHLDLPYLSPLSAPWARFGDLTVYEVKFPHFHSLAFFSTGFPFTYPAPVALVYYTIYHLSPVHPARGYVALCAAVFLIPAVFFALALRRRGLRPSAAVGFVLLLLLTSWPALLVIDRGNMEVAVFMVVLAGMSAFASGKSYWAAVFFGIAASMKLFPFVFLALFISRRQYKALFAGAASFFAVSIASLALLGPSLRQAYQGIANGLLFFRVNYMYRWYASENGVDHSAFGLVKGLRILVLNVPSNHVFSRSLSLYLVLSALTGITLYVFVIRFLPIINQILILTIASIFLTPFSGDGTLLHLYCPFAMLVFVSLRGEIEHRKIDGLQTAFSLLCLALRGRELSHLACAEIRRAVQMPHARSTSLPRPALSLWHPLSRGSVER